ncbi:hypothetical protein BY458DRAFT_499644 [Sporodiniella umbellata]|nr:hypothetical protein BY458DRAFT_499644 [Sporodiniella umbellata]
MKLSLLLTSFSALVCATSAYEVGTFGLMKRDHGLPYNSLPSTTCSAPSACSNIGTTVTCRCNDQITVCVNNNKQYCWGSQTLRSNACPTMPTTCSSSLTGSSTSCLCNGNNVLCVDNANNYCYGSVSAGAVSVTALPDAAVNAASSSVSSLLPSANTSLPASSSPAPTQSQSGIPTVDAPSIAPSPSTTLTSGSSQSGAHTLLTLASMMVVYLAIY